MKYFLYFLLFSLLAPAGTASYIVTYIEVAPSSSRNRLAYG